MRPDGTLEGGEFIQLPGNLHVYYVDCVTASGAHLIQLSGKAATITTKQRQSKQIVRHNRNHLVVTANPGARLVDPTRLDMRLMRRRIEMARKNPKEETVEENNTAGNQGSAEQKERATQQYQLVEGKTPKESMKGQGRLVFDTLSRVGGPVTVGQLTKQVLATGQLTTRQDAERVVGFYLSKFKRDGIVTVKAAEPAPAAAVV